MLPRCRGRRCSTCTRPTPFPSTDRSTAPASTRCSTHSPSTSAATSPASRASIETSKGLVLVQVVGNRREVTTLLPHEHQHPTDLGRHLHPLICQRFAVSRHQQITVICRCRGRGKSLAEVAAGRLARHGERARWSATMLTTPSARSSPPADQHGRRRSGDLTEARPAAFRHHDVDQPELVLEVEEGGALRGHRPLAVRDHTGDTHGAGRFGVPQLLRGEHPQRFIS